MFNLVEIINHNKLYGQTDYKKKPKKRRKRKGLIGVKK